VYSGELEELRAMAGVRDGLDEANQKKWLALAKDPEPVREGVWRLVYEAEAKGREHERVIYIPEKLTPKQVRERAEILPEPSLELIFHSSKELTEGDRSKLFTVRTTEKSSELVSASINRLLGDVLQKNRLESAATNQAFLVFPDATKLDKVRPAVLAALREGKVIAGKAASPRDTAALVGKLGAVGGPLAAAAASLTDTESDV